MSMATEIHQQTKARRARLGYVPARPIVLPKIADKPNLNVYEVVADPSADIAKAIYVPSLRKISQIVEGHFNIRRFDLFSHRRTIDIIRPRQICFYLARTCTYKSYPEIALHYGNRDHTTILHGVRKIEKLRLTDAKLNSLLCELERQFRFVVAEHCYWGA